MIDKPVLRRHSFYHQHQLSRLDARERPDLEATAKVITEFEAALKAATGHQGLGNKLHDQFRRVLAVCGRAPPPRAATAGAPGPVPPAPSPFEGKAGLALLKALCAASDGNSALPAWAVHQHVRALNLHRLAEQLERRISGLDLVPHGTES